MTVPWKPEHGSSYSRLYWLNAVLMFYAFILHRCGFNLIVLHLSFAAFESNFLWDLINFHWCLEKFDLWNVERLYLNGVIIIFIIIILFFFIFIIIIISVIDCFQKGIELNFVYKWKMPSFLIIFIIPSCLGFKVGDKYQIAF